MILTVDIGNSRIKWALWQADRIIARDVLRYSKEQPLDDFEELLSRVETSSKEELSRVFAVCVAEEKVTQALNIWVKQHWGLSVEYLKTEKYFNDITNAYESPEQHGVDRWAGIVAAHQRFPEFSICVIGAGTAITVDLVKKDGQHLGGYILPSYDIMHAALLEDTANVEAMSNVQFRENGVPDNTSDAVNQGLHKMIQAAVRELCLSAQNEMGGPVKIILTGGFAMTILEYPDMPEMSHQPDLVMQGLYDIMKSRKKY